MITIYPSGDLKIKVLEIDDTVYVAPGQEKPVLCEEEFLVKEQLITKHSKPLAMMVDRNSAYQSTDKTFALKGDTVKSMEIWFRAVHNTLTDMNPSIPVEEIWNITAAGDKYDFDVALLYKWFARWYEVYLTNPQALYITYHVSKTSSPNLYCA
ncbi:MAG: hypothetical protein Q9181_005301 [Wetmoreana brouardii]